VGAARRHDAYESVVGVEDGARVRVVEQQQPGESALNVVALRDVKTPRAQDVLVVALLVGCGIGYLMHGSHLSPPFVGASRRAIRPRSSSARSPDFLPGSGAPVHCTIGT